MHSVLLSFLNALPFLLSILTTLPILTTPAQAAFTAPISRNGDYIEPNAEGTFCYYPKALDPTSIDIACLGDPKGDFARVMEVHLNETTTINYFSASLERLGGPEWPVALGEGRKIYLCVSGRAGDYTYQTMCTTVGRDNSLGNGGPSPYCKREVGQRRVTDGCYIPNQPVPSFVAATSTRRPAIVTVTREVEGEDGRTSLVTSLSRSGALPGASQSSQTVEDGGSAITSHLNKLAILISKLSERHTSTYVPDNTL
ncbi:hypothetical protein CC1G_12036 [Coprinopsis cinerea okayama7|uniref:Uncharacterized protein n=1 Tax=Coprinopsis cinerea (strain Okayama-7 / 130 / ATCC MYA-4618 / FGSC 9003) TaxID=240176 RepID=A8P8H9_COPC7|nr:hypothetical protein CC1G_12036 [Coprinopsis cinerea okayama7\|eukprot:XP_001839573.1 hypothetical protein CC1G_12036 [Coprinopsis cinerea okayama7\